VKKLVRAGADPRLTPHGARTPILLAAAAGDCDFVRYLLDRGLDPNSTAHVLQSCQTQYRVTPLMEGSRVDDARTVALLLRRGAKLEARDSFGFTAAMIAAQHGSVRSLELLLDRGADVRTAGVNGWTALSLARHNRERAVVDLLRGAGENP
jgi:hypothetical protein